MKKLLTIILVCLVLFSLVGCSEEKIVTVNAENKESLAGQMFGKGAMIEIGSYLWYDSTTRIVYWWNGIFAYNNAIAPSPYYAPNGLPYLYNPETNTFEEINNVKTD